MQRAKVMHKLANTSNIIDNETKIVFVSLMPNWFFQKAFDGLKHVFYIV